MSTAHPLDFPAWSALNGRHARFAIQAGGVRRYDPQVGAFAGLPSRDAVSLKVLADLAKAHGDVVLLEAEDAPVTPGLALVFQGPGVQMVEARPAPAMTPDFEVLDLGAADAAEMVALAKLTEPGPFFSRTHELGGYVGVRVTGQLVAMAGERMQPDGYTEISAVCTHPDHRGRGYAAALMGVVGAGIRARGDIPFLHAYAGNANAIRLYEKLGYELRRMVTMVRLTAA